MKIPEAEIKYSGYSILDTFGRVFFWNDKVYRGLSKEGLDTYKQLIEVGLLPELESKSLFPKTTLTNLTSKYYDAILEHEKISPASFVYEWPFDMVKAAGECILDVNLIAQRYNYQTIDAHPYNVLFIGCKPVFIDIGSLIKVQDPEVWPALEEFYGYFKYPLELWNKVSHNMARRIYSEDLTAITADEYRKLLQLSTPTYKRKAKSLIKRIQNKLKLHPKKKPLLVQLQLAKADLHNLTRAKIETAWGDYHDDYVVSDEIATTDRFTYIVDKIKELNIQTVTELAGNSGLLSHLIFKNTNVKHINCTDYDENAVNKMFNHFKNTEYANRLSPALVDFIKPIELSNSGRPSSRFRSEAVLALAVTHHLVITYKYDINLIFKKVSEYSSKYVFIEFMPLGMWNGTWAPTPPSFYTQEWFTTNFENHFSVVDIKQIEENRILYIGTKLTDAIDN